MSVAVAFGIAALVELLLCFVSGLLLRCVEGVIFFASLTIMCGIVAIVSVERADSPSPKTIRCTSIEQIDTLYKNDSIVGYEIVIWEDSK